jgi:hypothetical protein
MSVQVVLIASAMQMQMRVSYREYSNWSFGTRGLTTHGDINFLGYRVCILPVACQVCTGRRSFLQSSYFGR